jgi:DNA-directed RNA polymerase specialized sigma24 family protein
MRGNRTNVPRAVDSGSPIDMTTLDSARVGDHRAWDAIVDGFAEKVWSVIRSHDLTPSQAADVSRLTWLRLLDQLDTIQREMVGSWLLNTAERESRRAVRLLAAVPGDDHLSSHRDGAGHPVHMG